MRRLRYVIEFESDWHVGTGHGISGGVDRTVVRDSDGFPTVPAKTVTGVVRAAAEQLAIALDEGLTESSMEGPWRNYVVDLFGDQPALASNAPASTGPRRATVGIRSAYYDAAFKNSIPRALQGSLCVIRSSTAINPSTGAAQQHTLRQIEVARAGSRLIGEVTLEQDAAVEFLTLAFASVRSLGGNRRRGLGKCRIRLLDSDGREFDVAEAVSRIGRRPNANPEIEGSDAFRMSVSGHTDDSVEWRDLELTVTLEEPVVIRQGVRGNIVETSDHIGGTQLLPVITDVAPEKIRPLVASGNLVITPATPRIDSQRSSPVPFCLSQAKEADNTGDRAVTNTMVAIGPEPPSAQQKQLRTGWIVPTQKHDTADTVTLKRAVVAVARHSHAVIADESQRPDETTGGLFTYGAIDPGQIFVARIGLRSDRATADLLRDGLDGATVSIGTSRKDGYGRVSLQCRTAADQYPARASTDTPETCTEVIVLCASDVIVLGDTLRNKPDAKTLGEHIARRTGLSAGEVEVDQTSVRLRTRRLDGWHGRWGLPRLSLDAICAGSVLRIRFNRPVRREELRRIEHEGLGERCAEGFGFVMFNPPVVPERPRLESASVDRVSIPAGYVPEAAQGEAEGEYEERLRDRIFLDHWRQTLSVCVDQALTGPNLDKSISTLRAARLSPSQWSQLRSILQTAAGARGGEAKLDQWIEKQRQDVLWRKVIDVISSWRQSPSALWHAIGFADSGLFSGSTTAQTALSIETISDVCEKVARRKRGAVR